MPRQPVEATSHRRRPPRRGARPRRRIAADPAGPDVGVRVGGEHPVSGTARCPSRARPRRTPASRTWPTVTEVSSRRDRARGRRSACAGACVGAVGAPVRGDLDGASRPRAPAAGPGRATRRRRAGSGDAVLLVAGRDHDHDLGHPASRGLAARARPSASRARSTWCWRTKMARSASVRASRASPLSPAGPTIRSASSTTCSQAGDHGGAGGGGLAGERRRRRARAAARAVAVDGGAGLPDGLLHHAEPAQSGGRTARTGAARRRPARAPTARRRPRRPRRRGRRPGSRGRRR